MTIPYFLRLICLCAASFFLVHAVLGFALSLTSRLIIKFAHRMKPREAARFLLVVRFLPLAVSAVVSLGICLPSYLRLEPGATEENVGTGFILAAICGTIILTLSLLRACRAVSAARRFTRQCDEICSEVCYHGTNLPIDVIECDAPVLLLVGVVKPRLVFSRAVMDVLSPQQIDSIIGHEQAHLVSRDNLKRLLLMLSPEIIPFVRCFDTLDHAWAQFSEWAADDDSSAGDPERSISLAESLVRVARMGAPPRPLPLFTSLVPPDQDLSARVNRLLVPPSSELKSWPRMRVFVGATAGAFVLFVALLLVLPGALQSVHQFLERLTH
jgi:beta-lactamase regulating signal transducer with metallopeptidase domain